MRHFFFSYHQGDVEDSNSTLQWTDATVRLLISCYKDHEEDFENTQKKKKDVWEKVTATLRAQGYNFSAMQVEQKWRN